MELNPYKKQCERMAIMLTECGARFTIYADKHTEKVHAAVKEENWDSALEHLAKARENIEMASRCYASIVANLRG